MSSADGLSMSTDALLTDITAVTTYLQSLSTLVRQRIKQRKPDLHPVLRFRSRRVRVFVQTVLREHCFVTALLYVLSVLFISTLLELIPLGYSVVRVLAYCGLACATVALVVYIVLTAEQIGRLIHRTASYGLMLQLYFAIVCVYALIYLHIEQMRPNSFHNVTRDKSVKMMRSVYLYIDFLYFSNMCQSAVGFGDVSPYFTLGRLFVTSQMIVSSGFLSILFSNWIM